MLSFSGKLIVHEGEPTQSSCHETFRVNLGNYPRYSRVHGWPVAAIVEVVMVS